MTVDRNLRAMLPLFAAVFIDLFSFGLMYPVIVALFHLPAIEAAYPVGVRGLYLSLALSLFPLGMFFGASLLGDLSDAFGRRRTLLVCMAGLGVAYLLMLVGVQTGNLLWFLCGRLLSGLMAGTSPIAQAAMMDHTTEADRGRKMSNVVLVNCVALVAGPAAGGVLGHFDFRVPLLFALALCGVAFAWIRFGMAATEGSGALRLGWQRPFEIAAQAWRHPVLRSLAVAFFLFQLGFGIYYVYIMVFMTRAYQVNSAVLGLFSAVMGVAFVAGSTIGYARAKAWCGDDARVARRALALCGACVLLAALPVGELAQWVLSFFVCAANVSAFVALLTLISGSASATEQGWALGIGASMTALAFFAAGLIATVIAYIPLPAVIALGGVVVLAGILPLRAATERPTASGNRGRPI